jgi:tetratricopeptide (TPR) repeat protein
MVGKKTPVGYDKVNSRNRMLAASAAAGFLLLIPLVVLFLAYVPLQAQEGKSLEEEWKQPMSAEASFSQGLKEFQANRYDRASAAFEKCIQKMPRHVYAHYYLADLYYIQGDYQRSLLHVSADTYLSGLFGAPVCANKKDTEHFAAPPDRYIDGGEALSYDGFQVQVISTPGIHRGVFVS